MKKSGFLYNLAWIVFTVILVANLADIYKQISRELVYNDLPFRINNSDRLISKDIQLEKSFRQRSITRIDTLSVEKFRQYSRSGSRGGISFDQERSGKASNYLKYLAELDSVSIEYIDENSELAGTEWLFPVKDVNRTILFTLLFNIFLHFSHSFNFT